MALRAPKLDFIHFDQWKAPKYLKDMWINFGGARRVIVTQDDTTILGAKGDPDRIQQRLAEIKKQIKRATSDYDREKLQERLAKLAGGVAIIRVGAPTVAQIKERTRCFEHTVSALQTWLDGGDPPVPFSRL